MTAVEIFTDGACRGNPGPGGWGVLLRFALEEKRLCGGELHTTNNRMELQAVIEGLDALKYPCKVSLTTDSQYVKSGFNEWLPNWKRSNWRTRNGRPVKNKDLWQSLDRAANEHQITWYWIKGHSGHPENEIADQLANKGVDEAIQGG